MRVVVLLKPDPSDHPMSACGSGPVLSSVDNIYICVAEKLADLECAFTCWR